MMKPSNQVKIIQSIVAKPVFICVLLLLAGCITTQPYGSFIQNPSPAFGQYSTVMAEDVAGRIARLYPAASTRFDMQHAATDPFGEALIENLRIQGYAVSEAAPADSIFALSSEQDKATADNPVEVTDSVTRFGLALSYIIDHSDDLYHVSILIDDQRLTRAFVAQSEQIAPAGLWVRRQ
ncbi:conjugal transfer protein TrbH [Nitrosomonas aestuarii]|uniref:conjugal transfer protein TrbH n=1 Tax=Nitrosomonas aestuarii TaxID=52441 RepID=UPI000D3FE778|nr:conjugal transfer protein TrbH [Nitrosomonas aestuarii]PTN07473.1 conjugative transfer protein TrbH [Nitrosomonas aestuarii]